MRYPLFRGQFAPVLASVGSTVYSLVRHVTMFKGSLFGSMSLHAHARCNTSMPGPQCPSEHAVANLNVGFPHGVTGGTLHGPLSCLYESLYAVLDGATVVLRLVSGGLCVAARRGVKAL